MGEEEETVWGKSEHADKNETKKSGVTLKLFLKTQAGVGYSESLESVTSFFFFLFPLSNFEDTVRRLVFRDGLCVSKGRMR